jgi:translation initiation factor 2 subunit 3
LDPALAKSDGLVGKVAGKPGTLPEVLSKLTLEAELFSFLMGGKEDVRIEPLKHQEVLMVTASTTLTVGVVDHAEGGRVEISLKRPVCAEPGQRTALARRVGSRWRLIGYGIIQ